MIDAGAFLGADGLYLALVLAAVALALLQALRRPGPRLLADRLLLRLPVLGGLAREVLAARFKPYPRDAAGERRAAGRGAWHRPGRAWQPGCGRGRGAHDAERAGGRRARSAAGRCRGIFPSRLIYLLRLGEETAQLGPLALRAAEIHEENTRLSIQRLVALLVPVITVIMGAVVAGIVSSLILAMLSLNNLAN